MSQWNSYRNEKKSQNENTHITSAAGDIWDPGKTQHSMRHGMVATIGDGNARFSEKENCDGGK